MLADLGGQQRFVQFNRIIPRIKTEIPASKESSEAAVPCVQGRIFADGDDKKGDIGCIVLGSESRYQVSARLSQPNPPSTLLNTQGTIDTHQTRPKIY